MQTEQADILIQQLLADGRVVVSPWRALILLRRAARTIPRADRAWRSPRTMAQVGRILRHMRQQGQLEPVEGHRGIFHLAVPEARTTWPSEEELLFELMPYAMLSHRSALIHHGLTTLRPSVFTVTVARPRPTGLFPVGTEAAEWTGLRPPGSHHPPTLRGLTLRIHTTERSRFFGHEVDLRRGLPLRVTSLERSLLDCLLAPELSGGSLIVFEAWMEARDRLDVDRLVSLADRYGIRVLQVRTGFLLERLGLRHPALDEWRRLAQRGGSNRLVAGAPYSGDVNPIWNLSLNGPVDVLEAA